TVHPSSGAARAIGAGVFATKVQFDDLVGPHTQRLVEIWNSLPGVKPVTKFTSRKIASERIWKAIQGFGDLATSAPASNPRVGPMEPARAPVGVPATWADPEVAEAKPPLEGTAEAARVATVGAQAPYVAPTFAMPGKRS